MGIIRSLPELLAPAGGRAQLEAAVNNGADAVYMGGSLFNARINAENFTEESLAEVRIWILTLLLLILTPMR